MYSNANATRNSIWLAKLFVFYQSWEQEYTYMSILITTFNVRSNDQVWPSKCKMCAGVVCFETSQRFTSLDLFVAGRVCDMHVISQTWKFTKAHTAEECFVWTLCLCSFVQDIAWNSKTWPMFHLMHWYFTKILLRCYYHHYHYQISTSQSTHHWHTTTIKQTNTMLAVTLLGWSVVC